MVKKILKIAFLAFVIIFIYAPILVLVFFSFTNSNVLGQWNGFSLELYRQLFSNAKIMQIVKDTLFLALLSSILATLLGTIGAIGLFYSKKRVSKVVGAATHIPVINAEIVTAIALTLLFTMFLGGKSYYSVLIGHIVICLPFVVLSVMPKLKQMDNNLYEAAMDLGATPFKALWTVVLPEILPGILAGFMLSITLSFDDYIVTAMTKPASFDTISTYVYQAVKNGRNSLMPALRALSSIIFVLMITFVLIFNIKGKKNKRSI